MTNSQMERLILQDWQCLRWNASFCIFSVIFFSLNNAESKYGTTWMDLVIV